MQRDSAGSISDAAVGEHDTERAIVLSRDGSRVDDREIGKGLIAEAGDPIQLSPIRTTNAGQGFQGFFRPTE